MIGKPNQMVSQHHHFEYVIIPIPRNPRYMPCRISIKALRATMASSSADIRLTNLEVAMNEDVSWLSKSENLGNLPDSQKVLEFGILDVDSQCSPFIQKKLIAALVCVRNGVFDDHPYNHIMAIHFFPSTWSVQNDQKVWKSKAHQHPAIRFHFFSGHAGVVEICTASWWIFKSSKQQSVTATKTHITYWWREVGETWRQIMSETPLSTSTTRSALRKGKRATLAKMRNCHGVPNYQFVSCCHTLCGLGRKGCMIAPHSSWVARDRTFDLKILKICMDGFVAWSSHPQKLIQRPSKGTWKNKGNLPISSIKEMTIDSAWSYMILPGKKQTKQHMMYLWRDESVFWQFWKYSAMEWKIRPAWIGRFPGSWLANWIASFKTKFPRCICSIFHKHPWSITYISK